MSKINAIAEYFTPTNFYDYKINQSLRFEDGDDAYLNRTFGTPTNNKKWTYSVWMKRGNLSTNQAIMSADFDGSNYWDIRFNTSNQIYIQNRIGASNLLLANTTAVFRDVSAFYHIVFVYDSDNATASDRAILYVNGVSQTLSASPSSGDASGYNVSGEPHHIGVSRTLSSIGGIWSEFDGYQAEINFVDGQALDPTDFGETKNGIWIAKKYTGTYGNNGFYLDFADGSALGDDESGNGNDFTSNNLASTDVVPDTPTNNFATWNINGLQYGGTNAPTLSEGSLKTATSGNPTHTFSTFAITPADTTPYYWEVKATSLDVNRSYMGIVGLESDPATATAASYSYDLKFVLSNTGHLYGNSGTGGSTVSYTSWATGDILMFAYKDGKIWIGKNGTWMNSGNPAAGTGDLTAQDGGRPSDRGDVTWYPYVGFNSTYTANFGQDGTFAGTETSGGYSDANGIGDFLYQPPSGFLALCSNNLPEPSISPLHGEQPADYFDTQLWTGTGSGQSFSNWSFQPDWLWFKHRNGASDHAIFDSIRGVNSGLSSNSTAAANTAANSTQDLVSFDSDGFTTGTPSQYGSLGSNTHTIVTWGWAAGTSYTPTVTGGFSSPSASINTEAGFGIYKVTGSNTTSSFTHGLGSTPTMIIAKNLGNSYNWGVFHKDLSNTTNKALFLNLTNAETTKSGIWQTIDATTVEVLSYAETGSNGDYIYYVFTDIEGYSKMGSFQGNGNNDGVYVFTGFRPAFLMVRAVDKGAGWHMFDNKRAFTGNEIDVRLEADNSDAEGTGGPPHIDLLSNGFKLRTSFDNINHSGGNHIYMAFAEQPFKYANAR